MSWSSISVLKDGENQVIGASETDTVISKTFRVTDPRYIIVDVTAASVTASTGITVKLEDSSGDDVWNTKGAEGNVAIPTNGTFSIKLLIENTSDQAELPLRPLGRLTITTGASDAATITDLKVSIYE